jgi:hypothetical protein
MQRLAVAFILVALAVAAIGVAASAVRATWRSVDGAVQEPGRGGEFMQKVAFILLVVLIAYVSVLGGA